MRFFPTTYLLVALAVIPLKTLAADENDAELIRSMQRQQHIDAELLTCRKSSRCLHFFYGGQLLFLLE